METHYFWAFFVIALMVGAGFTLAYVNHSSSAMTGYAYKGWTPQDHWVASTPSQPSLPSAASESGDLMQPMYLIPANQMGKLADLLKDVCFANENSYNKCKNSGVVPNISYEEMKQLMNPRGVSIKANYGGFCYTDCGGDFHLLCTALCKHFLGVL